MRASRLRPTAARPSRSSRLPALRLRPSADLAGRSVALSIDVPPSFDALGALAFAPHHKLLAAWAAGREDTAQRYTRVDARQYVERTFNAAVLDILKPLDLATLRVVVLIGDEQLPPAIAVICDDIGQLDLKWIEKSNVLSNTLFGRGAPVSWQATAYQALETTLKGVLPVFGFDDLMEELSGYYWDGESEDDEARRSLIDYFGHDPEEVASMTMPSQVRERRPDWMLATNATALKNLSPGLRQRLGTLRKAHHALKGVPSETSAWGFDWDNIREYMPHYEDAGTLPPLTLVPFDHFQQELDDVCRPCMETSFIDIAGLCQLTDAGTIDVWLHSLKMGVDMLLAAQALIDIDPTDASPS